MIAEQAAGNPVYREGMILDFGVNLDQRRRQRQFKLRGNPDSAGRFALSGGLSVNPPRSAEAATPEALTRPGVVTEFHSDGLQTYP